MREWELVQEKGRGGIELGPLEQTVETVNLKIGGGGALMLAESEIIPLLHVQIATALLTASTPGDGERENLQNNRHELLLVTNIGLRRSRMRHKGNQSKYKTSTR